MKLKLTSSVVKSFPRPAKKMVYRDTEVIGFGVEIRASGKATYWFYYTTPDGKAAQIKIGGCEDITFEEAKRRAKEMRSSVVLGGE